MRYHTAELLSQGATGEIYQAYDPVLRRQVALKFLLRDDPVAAERMLREARAQARVDHPNVCQVYEVGELDGRPYIAMQLVEGEDLRTAARSMTLEQKVQVVRKIAEALHAAHQEGLVHRDMKPANVMVEATATGQLKPVVVDFGLVQEIEAAGLTRTGEVMGTPAYMAPEQARGEVRNLDRRTDVYSLGATFYDLLTGRPPFTAEGTVELLMQVIEQDPPPLRRIEPAIPADLETIVLKCLEKEPGRRYGSARALAEDLDRYLEGSPIEARRASLAYRLTKTARRHRALVAVSAVALAATIGLSTWAMTERWRAARESELTQRYTQEGKDLEWMIRAVHTAPKHDIRPEKTRVRRRIDGLLKELDDLGAAGAGPGHYAVGRGYLVLLEIEEAHEHLEKAWDAGFRSPEVAYALGMTLGELYEQELDRRPVSLSQPGARERLRAELDQRWKQPALELLEVSRKGETHAPEYVEGLMALYDQDWELARQKARAALDRLPWLYEARTLIAVSLYREAQNNLETGKSQGTLELLEASEEAYERAIDAAPSYPRAYSGLCVLKTTVVSLQTLGESAHEKVPELAEEALAACREAESVDRELSEPYESLSHVYRMLAQYLQLRHQDASGALTQAKQAARRAVELGGDDPGTHVALAAAYLQEAEQHTTGSSSNPLPLLEQAAESFRRALELEPFYNPAGHGLGLVAINKAEYRTRQGEDPDAAYVEAIRLLEEAARLAPEAFEPNYNLGAVHRERAAVALDQGREFVGHYRAAVWRLERALKAQPGDVWTLSELSFAKFGIGIYEILQDRDSGAIMAEAGKLADEVLEQGPPVTWFLYRRALVAYFQAIGEMVENRDPEPYLDVGREALARAYEIAPDQVDGYGLGFDTELLSAEWALQVGLSAEKPLARAEELLEKVVARSEGYDEAIVEAQFYRWQAEWWLRNPRPARQAVEKGLEAARRAVEERPDDTYAYGLVGELHLLLALTEVEAEKREEAAARSFAMLDRTLELNRWRTFEFGESYERARILAGEPKVGEPAEAPTTAAGF